MGLFDSITKAVSDVGGWMTDAGNYRAEKSVQGYTRQIDRGLLEAKNKMYGLPDEDKSATNKKPEAEIHVDNVDDIPPHIESHHQLKQRTILE